MKALVEKVEDYHHFEVIYTLVDFNQLITDFATKTLAEGEVLFQALSLLSWEERSKLTQISFAYLNPVNNFIPEWLEKNTGCYYYDPVNLEG